LAEAESIAPHGHSAEGESVEGPGISEPEDTPGHVEEPDIPGHVEEPDSPEDLEAVEAESIAPQGHSAEAELGGLTTRLQDAILPHIRNVETRHATEAEPAETLGAAESEDKPEELAEPESVESPEAVALESIAPQGLTAEAELGGLTTRLQDAILPHTDETPGAANEVESAEDKPE
jgi:hypothetical protein